MIISYNFKIDVFSKASLLYSRDESGWSSKLGRK